MSAQIIPLPTASVGRPLVPVAAHAADYPMHGLGVLRPAVEAARQATQAPVAIAAQTALALASLAVQGFADVETLGGYRPTSLFLMTIAKSGERKTTVDRCLSGDIDTYDRVVTEPTTDGLFRVLKDAPSAGLMSDEAGAFLGGYAMRSSQVTRTFATHNSLWDGKQIKLARAKDELVLRGRRVALHLMAQPDVAAGLLSNPLAESIGFLPRCLMVEPASMIGQRVIGAAPSRETEKTLEFFQMRLKDLMDKPLPIPDAEVGALAPRRLPLADDARDYLVKIANALEQYQAPGERFADVTAYASKTCEHACRIAGVLTLWRDDGAAEVDLEAMKGGMKLAYFYLLEAQRLMGRASTDETLRLADELRVWLLARHEKEFVTGDVQQRAPRRQMRQAAVARKLLSILEDHSWVRRLPDGALINGVPRKSGWTIR